MSKIHLLLIMIALLPSVSGYAKNKQLEKDAVPFFGAQIFIELDRHNPR